MKLKEENEIKVKQVIHKFYCDECKKYIGSSDEYSDGYYDELGNVIDIQFYYKNGWYKLDNKIYCVDCHRNKEKEILEKLKDIGFIKE